MIVWSLNTKHGDIVIFEKTNNCESGQHCAVMVNGNDATFKKVIINKDTGSITLLPLNTKYDPITYSNSEIKEIPVKILGVAKERRTKIS